MGANTINLVPVSYCANLVAAATLHAPLSPTTASDENTVRILHTTPHPPFPFNAFLATLSSHGYTAPKVPYSQWRAALETYVSVPQHSEPHALLPLFDWVTADLPASTNSVPLDDTNAQAVLLLDRETRMASDPNAEKISEEPALPRITTETVAAYLAYMVEIGFIDPPAGAGGFPVVRLNEGQKEALRRVGRGGV